MSKRERLALEEKDRLDGIVKTLEKKHSHYEKKEIEYLQETQRMKHDVLLVLF